MYIRYPLSFHVLSVLELQGELARLLTFLSMQAGHLARQRCKVSNPLALLPNSNPGSASVTHGVSS